MQTERKARQRAVGHRTPGRLHLSAGKPRLPGAGEASHGLPLALRCADPGTHREASIGDKDIPRSCVERFVPASKPPVERLLIRRFLLSKHNFKSGST
jgi:hypothetical protein